MQAGRQYFHSSVMRSKGTHLAMTVSNARVFIGSKLKSFLSIASQKRPHSALVQPQQWHSVSPAAVFLQHSFLGRAVGQALLLLIGPLNCWLITHGNPRTVMCR